MLDNPHKVEMPKEEQYKFMCLDRATKYVNETQQNGICYMSHTSRPPKKIQALQMGVTLVPWGGDRLVEEALLVAPLN